MHCSLTADELFSIKDEDKEEENADDDDSDDEAGGNFFNELYTVQVS
jgi:hypothetical protein